jgi:hypothetical protein
MDFTTNVDHSDEVWQQPNCRTFVLPGLVSLGGGSVVADGHMVPIERFLEHFVSTVPAQTDATPISKPKPKASSPISPDLLAKHPWLCTFLEQQGKPARPSTEDGALNNEREGDGNIAENLPVREEEPGQGDDSEDGDDQRVSDSAVEAAFEEVRRRREGWAADVVQPVDFRHTILGGAWARVESGAPHEWFMGKAATDRAKSWCLKYNTPQSAKFSISVYGNEGCSMMVQAWAHKMQHFLDIAYADGSAHYKYTRSDISQYVEPTEFTEFVSGLPEGRAKTRALQLRKWFPKG